MGDNNLEANFQRQLAAAMAESAAAPNTGNATALREAEAEAGMNAATARDQLRLLRRFTRRTPPKAGAEPFPTEAEATAYADAELDWAVGQLARGRQALGDSIIIRYVAAVKHTLLEFATAQQGINLGGGEAEEMEQDIDALLAEGGEEAVRQIGSLLGIESDLLEAGLGQARNRQAGRRAAAAAAVALPVIGAGEDFGQMLPVAPVAAPAGQALGADAGGGAAAAPANTEQSLIAEFTGRGLPRAQIEQTIKRVGLAQSRQRLTVAAAAVRRGGRRHTRRLKKKTKKSRKNRKTRTNRK